MDAPWAEGVRDHSTSADTIRCLSRASGKPRSVTGKRRESSTVMPHQDEPERARALLDLHQPGNPVILPTVWDAWSAKLAVGAGFAALTVGSHPLSDSIGKPDNEGMSFDDVLTRVAQITAAVPVPVSVDIESGYGQPASRLIEGLLGVGAVGLNIEDTVHSARGRLRSSGEHAELVGALRSAADAAGVQVVINARTDLFLRQEGDA